MALPDWRLPPGVTRGAWDYTQSRAIADDYDDYHAENTLFEFEENILAETFGEAPPARAGGAHSDGVIADLGCGSGRALVPLVRRGWRGLAVDLSDAMLDVVREKAAIDGLPIECVLANLVELTPDLVADESADHAMCLFSTLGMIRGRDNRLAALGHMRRILKPGGKLVLHVHNFWFNLRDPGGPWWALRSLARGAFGKSDYETGDKTYPYRGVPNFFLHVFRERELRRDLREANLTVLRWIPLDVGRRHALRRPWLAPSLRANGWIIVCERPKSPSLSGRG
ncbi:ubiquinone/menaquinone biosynthesis methyltransferase [Botrimarina colliarenosi]|uniref:Ubiquinone/menaquinone biosynthesis methyltransferase n=1 Tax=Botrimarina colliarenosi TaxID=2528001 RepID=A0A5C6AIW6_9BACT|nr:class I SAM-dependent methyltransferase [Botrimarina colliarenosi]TWT99350.1 ubiquinone/menaquinone biosynthesis methyltransferase [Botrimarina colliarenosi]